MLCTFLGLCHFIINLAFPHLASSQKIPCDSQKSIETENMSANRERTFIMLKPDGKFFFFFSHNPSTFIWNFYNLHLIYFKSKIKKDQTSVLKMCHKSKYLVLNMGIIIPTHELCFVTIF